MKTYFTLYTKWYAILMHGILSVVAKSKIYNFFPDIFCRLKSNFLLIFGCMNSCKFKTSFPESDFFPIVDLRKHQAVVNRHLRPYSLHTTQISADVNCHLQTHGVRVGAVGNYTMNEMDVMCIKKKKNCLK